MTQNRQVQAEFGYIYTATIDSHSCQFVGTDPNAQDLFLVKWSGTAQVPSGNGQSALAGIFVGATSTTSSGVANADTWDCGSWTKTSPPFLSACLRGPGQPLQTVWSAQLKAGFFNSFWPSVQPLYDQGVSAPGLVRVNPQCHR